jgi:predicted O-methyltransferase YrrM
MSIKSLFSHPSLDKYIDEKSINLNSVALELFAKAKTDEFSNMLSSPNQMQLISIFLKMINAKNVLEIGVFRGFSTLVMAQALPQDGKIEACDISYDFVEPYQQFWTKAEVDSKINLNIAPALETLESFTVQGRKFDFVYIDADKVNYINYYRKTLDLVNSGGVIAIDNVLWSGEVANSANNEQSTVAIRQLNELIHNDSRIESCIIPIGDGVNLIRKK